MARRSVAIYAAGAVALIVAYSVVTGVLWSQRNFDERGPLSFRSPALTQPLAGAIPVDEARRRCLPDVRGAEAERVKVVGGLVHRRPYYGCFQLSDDGSVFKAVVVDGQGFKVKDPKVIKDGGAWRWIGLVKTPGELVLGGVGLATLFAYSFVYYRRARPGLPAGKVPAWQQPWVLLPLGVTCVGGIAIALARALSPARRVRTAMQVPYVWAGAFLFGSFTTAADAGDRLGITVMVFLAVALFGGAVAGRRLLAPEGWGAPDNPTGFGGSGTPPAGFGGSASEIRGPTAARVGSSGAGAARARDDSVLRVQRPGSLPCFADVGGMDVLKRELSDTFGLVLAFSGEADAYKIRWNGVLLHGPPGVGKTFIARATAGEFALNLLQVSVGDLVSAYRGESARNVADAFRVAAANVPCLLFFDEFDSIAVAREDWPDPEARRTVNQLLQSLEEYRSVSELVVMAATNDLDALDPAVVRAGRFDRHVRIDLPDAPARRAILAVQLEGRPTASDVDLDDLARRAAGLTPASMQQIVEMAALAAFKAATTSGGIVELSMQHLLDAFAGRGGRDRPTVEEWNWDRVVLQERTKDELIELQHLVEDPERARAYGVQPPSGVLLAGPPGTGKTTIAKVLAAQANCSFYPVSAADIVSKWVGESEQNVQRLFRRARENAPSIVFIDELDALAAKRGDLGSDNFADRLLNQLLAEIDGMSGQRGVFVLAATNRPDTLDPAILRGGRLSRTITIPLPDIAARRRLLALMTAAMPVGELDLDALATKTDGLSGADIHALCQEAALQAMVRGRRDPSEPGTPASVTAEDFATALVARQHKSASPSGPDGGYV